MQEHVYQSPLCGLPSLSKEPLAVSIIVKDRADDDPLLLPHEIVVLLEIPGHGHTPIPIIRAHRNVANATAGKPVDLVNTFVSAVPNLSDEELDAGLVAANEVLPYPGEGQREPGVIGNTHCQGCGHVHERFASGKVPSHHERALLAEAPAQTGDLSRREARKVATMSLNDTISRGPPIHPDEVNRGTFCRVAAKARAAQLRNTARDHRAEAGLVEGWDPTFARHLRQIAFKLDELAQYLTQRTEDHAR